MTQFLATAVIGSILAIATALLVSLYLAMGMLFRALQVLTFPLHMAWRALHRAET